jgi:NitT/TauT family transport system ATP-binding protein
VIALEHVTREFESPSGVVYCALDDLSLTIEAGTFTAIVGPSGCGKSTLLNMVAGLLPASGGTIRVGGEPLHGLNRRATYMFQQDALLPWKDVRENVALGLTLGGLPRRDASDRADAWLARVGLAAFARHFPAQLSGGMRKRVAMAQNWIIDRDIVLMDEPFSALDIHTRQRMETELLALWETANRKTIVFVTHDLEEALALADQVVVLSAGPASRIVSRHGVALDRPRDLLELRTTAAFVDLYRAVWADLRDEVVRSQREPSRA